MMAVVLLFGVIQASCACVHAPLSLYGQISFACPKELLVRAYRSFGDLQLHSLASQSSVTAWTTRDSGVCVIEQSKVVLLSFPSKHKNVIV
jgi:hypothetical protein